MLNQVVLVGRIVDFLENEELENGNEVITITISVPRSFKNMNGEYDIDLIDCTLYGVIAKNAKEFCVKNDLVGIRGRLARKKDEQLKLIAEKVTFLNSRKGN